jgi:hypothetical protein
MCARVPLMRRRLPREYGALWKRMSAKVAGPQEVVEAARTEFFGLLIARMIAAIPVISIFARPLIAIAATRLVVEQRASR